MRLFTGVELSDAAREEVASASADLRRRVEARAPDAKLTWVAPERLHLTARFIGEASGPLAERIIEAVRAPLSFPPFTVTFDGFGAFPAKGPPRVLWLGVAGGVEALVQAEAAIGDRLAALGIPREARAYRPHLTLARVRDPRRLRISGLFERLATPSAATPVEAITLFESRLSPTGPAYRVLERIRFAGG